MFKLNVVKTVAIWVAGTPVPWSVPKIFRFGGSKKNPKLQAWQDTVTKAARLAWGPFEPHAGPVSLSLLFHLPKVHATDIGLVVPTIKRNAVTDKHTKRGLAIADLTNLAKAVEDALAGVVMVDDVLTRHKEEGAVYASRESELGVTIQVSIINPKRPIEWGGA
jgi:Holliday junction resolvase RusA-like endonuclease